MASTTSSTNTAADKQTLSVRALSALVIGSMVGAGIFTLPAAFGRATGALGALIAWVIAGIGMLMLAFVFQDLAQRKPDIDSGVFAYAKAGFGNYLGFAAALGFWAGSCVGNVSYFVLIKSTLGRIIPAFGDGNTLPAVLTASLLLWVFHFMILRGVQQATGLNNIVTVAKIVPILIFVLILIFNFNPGLFSLNFFGGEGFEGESILTQVRSTMLVTVFVFLGIEGASVYSRYAEKRSDVGTATVIGFLSVLCLLILVTILPYGIVPREALADLRNPSMAALLETIVGRWGSAFISIGLLVSVLGAYLAWTLFAAEVPFMAAKENIMPRWLARENSAGVPAASLWLTSSLVQMFLIVTLFSQYAFTLALELTSSLSLVPYLLVSAYGLKLAVTGETFDGNPSDRRNVLIFTLVATLYSLLMLYAGGLKYLLLSALIYAPGSLLFFLARREQGRHIFTFGEWFIFTLAVIAALSALYGLITGQITI
jgi:arginine:ornithine antiporter / lysine permease